MMKILAASGVFTVVLVLGGCGPMDGFSEATEEFHYSYPLTPGGRLNLRNINGSVEITGWDRSSIDVSGTKYSSDQSRLKEIKVDVNASGKDANITTDVPHGDWHGSYGVRYRVRVPNSIALDRVQTSNGSITVENLAGGGHLKSTNGKVMLTRLAGDYRAETTNGSIEIEECSGLQHADTTNGGVRGHLKEGAIEATSTNGAVNVTVDSPRADKAIKLSTTNGSLALALGEFHDNAVRIGTTHGSVHLRLPESTNAHLQAETSMASIHNDLPLSRTEQSSKHELRGQWGKGGPEIEASTSMGGISISRY